MGNHDILLEFGPLPASCRRRFIWNSAEWWDWFRSGRRKPSTSALVSRLQEYDSFISFHGARPQDVSAYYTQGIKLGVVDSLNAQAREIFLSGRYPEITPSILNQAIFTASRTDDRKVFVIVDEREISGHYLIYGSEHICGLAASMIIDAGFDCRQILKSFGTPTVFRIELARDLIPENQLVEFAEHVLEACWDTRKRTQPPRFDWSWILRQEIPGKSVLDHVHPEEIPDPLLRYISYSYRDNFPCLF